MHKFGPYEVNEIHIDDFGRPHGILAVNKPVGITSHDMVYEVRKVFGTKKVGHAGALDPFASGVLMIVMGKATVLSDDVMALPKSYTGKVLLGVSTNTQDSEGKITAIQQPAVTAAQLDAAIATFSSGYEQFVPVFSSIKINGQKLRQLAHKAADIRFEYSDGGKTAIFVNASGNEQRVELPKHKIDFTNLSWSHLEDTDLDYLMGQNDLLDGMIKRTLEHDAATRAYRFQTFELAVSCPKGTYIRQLAEDIGQRLVPPQATTLIGLTRTALGDIGLKDCFDILQLGSLMPN